jgi:hypothetical protein
MNCGACAAIQRLCKEYKELIPRSIAPWDIASQGRKQRGEHANASRHRFVLRKS